MGRESCLTMMKMMTYRMHHTSYINFKRKQQSGRVNLKSKVSIKITRIFNLIASSHPVVLYRRRPTKKVQVYSCVRKVVKGSTKCKWDLRFTKQFAGK